MYLCGCKLVSTQHALTYIKKIYRQNNMNQALWCKRSIRSFELSALSTRHLCSFNPGSRRTEGGKKNKLLKSPLPCFVVQSLTRAEEEEEERRWEPEEMLPNWVHARRRAGQQQHTHTHLYLESPLYPDKVSEIHGIYLKKRRCVEGAGPLKITKSWKVSGKTFCPSRSDGPIWSHSLEAGKSNLNGTP